jgi:predicted tellurium resistance membrane protein TerC
MSWLNWITEPESWIAFATLLALEIVLGIDNVVFISILADKLAANKRARARTLGLGLAMGTRVALLFCIDLVSELTTPLFSVFGYTVSGRDLVFIAGGLFLLAKSSLEIHHKMTVREENAGAPDQCLVCRCYHPDPIARYRLFDRFGGYGGRHGR